MRHCLRYEIGEHHAVTTCLPGSYNVEKTTDDDWKPFFLPIRQGQKLVECLRSRVAPASLGGRPQHQIIVLAEGYPCTLTVDFRSGGNKNKLPFLARRLQYEFGSIHVGFDGVDRALYNQAHANSRG